DAYYFQYGVTLYRLEEFNKSLIYLKIANENDPKNSELYYFMALNHLRLKEFPQAVGNFDTAIASGDQVIAPSSHFYKGVVYYTTEEYEKSKDSFQMVLDTSSDARLDRQAEEYIERILRIQQFRDLQSKPFNITSMLAVQNDSNVLGIDPTGGSSGSATDVEGNRLLATFEFGYRPIFVPE